MLDDAEIAAVSQGRAIALPEIENQAQADRLWALVDRDVAPGRTGRADVRDRGNCSRARFWCREGRIAGRREESVAANLFTIDVSGVRGVNLRNLGCRNHGSRR